LTTRSTRRGPGRPRQPIGRDTLLTAARAVFAAHGYAGASLAEIAARAGIQKASLLHHFPSKAALYEAAFAHVLAALAGLLPAPDVDRPFLDQLDALGHAVVWYFGAHPDAARLLLLEIVGNGPVVRSPTWQAVVQLERAIAALFERGMAQGALPPQDPGQLAMSVIGLHLTWFAAGEATRELTGADPFTPAAIGERAAIAAAQVRAICRVA